MSKFFGIDNKLYLGVEFRQDENGPLANTEWRASRHPDPKLEWDQGISQVWGVKGKNQGQHGVQKPEGQLKCLPSVHSLSKGDCPTTQTTFIHCRCHQHRLYKH